VSGFILLPLYIVIFLGLIYFVGIRPQQRRRRELESLTQRLKPGDEVITVAGIYGKVTEVETGGTLLLEISEDTEIRVATSSIARLVKDDVAATEPTSSEPAPE
jgi:preprotein translocase subunit YajC